MASLPFSGISISPAAYPNYQNTKPGQGEVVIPGEGPILLSSAQNFLPTSLWSCKISCKILFSRAPVKQHTPALRAIYDSCSLFPRLPGNGQHWDFQRDQTPCYPGSTYNFWPTDPQVLRQASRVTFWTDFTEANYLLVPVSSSLGTACWKLSMVLTNPSFILSLANTIIFEGSTLVVRIKISLAKANFK